MAQAITTESRAHILIDQPPEECPVCKFKMAPTFKLALSGCAFWNVPLQIVYLCTNSKCGALFLAYYKFLEETPAGNSVTVLQCTRPSEMPLAIISDRIAAVSPSFSDIYQEAFRADAIGLKEICGVGYRKALEFLIKDYAIKKNPDQEEAIQKANLSPCIENYVTDQKVKDVAKRATWLGNDETHYLRKFAGKDVSDLKRMIVLTMHWIEMEALTAESMQDMPGRA